MAAGMGYSGVFPGHSLPPQYSSSSSSASPTSETTTKEIASQASADNKSVAETFNAEVATMRKEFDDCHNDFDNDKCKYLFTKLDAAFQRIQKKK